MLIRTENQTAYWKYWHLFDTETGLQYSLCYPIRDKEGADVQLSINSAHSENTGNGYSMVYWGIEALDFWSQLDETSWGQQAHKEAIGVLEQIQKQEEEAPLGEGQRREELDELDIPF